MMKTLTFVLGFFCIVGTGAPAETKRFEKVSDHFYFFQSSEGGGNVGAVVTEDGVALINPPAEPALSVVLAALKRVSGKAVRWVLVTDYQYARAGALAHWADQGTVVLGSKELWQLAASADGAEGLGSKEARPAAGSPKTEASAGDALPSVRLEFVQQIFLFPSGIEVRYFALRRPAHTAADLVVLLPGEKVLQVGKLFGPGSYPEIDAVPGGGDAQEWIAGIKQVVDAVPLLKAAIPPPKPEPGKALVPEKTLEEMVVVIPGRGPQSNLQEMKNLLEASQKLRTETNRFIAAGSSRERLSTAAAFAPFRAYANFEAFAGQLFDLLSAK